MNVLRLKVAGLPLWVIDAFAHEFSQEETEPKVAITFFMQANQPPPK
jgi:hypothetical protein